MNFKLAISNQSRVKEALPDGLKSILQPGRSMNYQSKDISGNIIDILEVKPDLILDQVIRGNYELGVVGKDKIFESNMFDTIKIIKELPISECSLRFGIPQNFGRIDLMDPELNIFTSYPNIVSNYLKKIGSPAQINDDISYIPSGSVEIYPTLFGGKSIIADITETGTTMKENGLTMGEVIFQSQLCVCSAMDMSEEMREILQKLGL